MWALLLLLAADDQTWLIRTSRMEGAALNVREAAAELKTVTAAVADGGRLYDVARIHHLGFELNRRVVSAGLAAQVLSEPE